VSRRALSHRIEALLGMNVRKPLLAASTVSAIRWFVRPALWMALRSITTGEWRTLFDCL
jgi:hypothetical protein